MLYGIPDTDSFEGRPMRLAGLLIALLLGAVAAFQSIVGGAPPSEADDGLTLAASDICAVDAATVPVLATETRDIVTTPAHRMLTVTPAVFGTRTETVTVVPEHRHGATFAEEEKRIIVSDPTRRLRAIPPVFDIELVVGSRGVTRYRVTGGALVAEMESLPELPDNRIVISEARIQAVRVNAGLRMMQIHAIDQNGRGAVVPAETVEIEVRSVEEQPAVATTDIAAVTEPAQVVVVETPAGMVEAEAVCTIAERAPLIRHVQAALTARGIEAGTPGEWTPATIDALAAAQAEETGLVAPALLVRTLRAWVPQVALPAGTTDAQGTKKIAARAEPSSRAGVD